MGRRAALLASAALVGAVLITGAAPPAGGQTATTTVPTTTVVVPPDEVPAVPDGPGDGTNSRLLPVAATPNTGLLDGQVIQVSGSGFTPGADLGVVTCAVAAAEGGVTHCDISQYGSARAAADGTFSATYALHRLIYTEADGELDCGGAPQACIVVAANIGDYDESGGAPIDFDATVPPPPAPTLTVDPATGILDNQPVTVAGAGFEPGGRAYLTQCALEDDVVVETTCEYSEAAEPPRIGPDGTFTGSQVVHRLLFDGFEPVDCAATPCALVAGPPLGPGRSVHAVLGFDATVPPPPPPALVVEPGDQLVDGQELVVTGTGFRPGEQPYLVECLAETSPDDELGTCSDGSFGGPLGSPFQLPATVGPDGRFVQRVLVERILVDQSGEIDCGTGAGRCELRTGLYDGTPARVPLAFDPDVPPPAPPTLEIDPGSGLTGRQVVHLGGAGFRDVGYHVVLQCVAGDALPDYGDCDERSQLPLPILEDGSIDSSTRLRRSLRTSAGTVDCAEAPGRCVLHTGFPFDPGRPASVPLTFDPSLPRAPKPAVTVSPGRDLVDGQEVTVSGTAMLPGRPVLVSQCLAAVPEEQAVPNGCSFYDGGLLISDEDDASAPTVGNDGTFSSSFRVSRIVVGRTKEFDCVLDGGCTVVASQEERRPPSTAIAFDASAPPPAPATLAVAPAEGLADGQTVAVTGTGFRPGSEVYVVQCLARGSSTSRCSRLAGEAQVDDEGVLRGDVKVRREIGYEELSDCATVDGGCTLETGVAYDGARISATPIAFDPTAPPAPPPAVEVAPSTELADGQEVAVTGAGFSPGSSVVVLQCSALAADDAALERCDLSTAAVVEADEAGSVATGFVVRSSIATRADGVVDCPTAPEPCAVVVASLFDDRERGGVVLGFGAAPEATPLLVARAGAGTERAPDAYLGAGGRSVRAAGRG